MFGSITVVLTPPAIESIERLECYLVEAGEGSKKVVVILGSGWVGCWQNAVGLTNLFHWY